MANKAAFSREDVADAKRGAPAVSLAGYAADRGLQFLDHATPAGYRTAVPCDPEFQFNLMRGPLPGGEFGLVGHEAFGLPWVGGTVAWSGWVETVGKPKGTGLRVRDFALSMLPGADLFTGWGSEKVEPLRTPCTIAAVRLPESAGLQPHLRIDNRDAAPPYDFGNDVDLHALGLLLHADPAAPADLLDAFLAEPVASTLNAHAGDPLFQVLITCATLVVRRNGWIADPAQLDELCGFAVLAGTQRARGLPRPAAAPAVRGAAAASGLADRRGAGARVCARAALAGVGDGDRRDGSGSRSRARSPTTAPSRSVPAPGFAKVVMRGTLPVLGVPGRLVVHTEPGASRAAVVVPAPEGVTSARPTATASRPTRRAPRGARRPGRRSTRSRATGATRWRATSTPCWPMRRMYCAGGSRGSPRRTSSPDTPRCPRGRPRGRSRST